MKTTLNDIILSALSARFVGKRIIPPNLSLPQTVSRIEQPDTFALDPAYVFHYAGGGFNTIFFDDEFQLVEEEPDDIQGAPI